LIPGTNLTEWVNMDISHKTKMSYFICVSTCCENYSNAPCHHWYNLSVKKLLWTDHLHLIDERVSSLRFGCSGWVRPYAWNDHTSARSDLNLDLFGRPLDFSHTGR